MDGNASSTDGPPSQWMGPTPFLSRDALVAAVDNCLAADETGSCDCSDYDVDCGAAVKLPITEWDVSLVTSMSSLFLNAESFNADISDWNTSAVTSMAYMFNGARSFTQDITNWNTRSVLDMKSMLQSTSTFNQPIGVWDTSSVTDMSYMFQFASLFNQNVSAWNLSLIHI